MSNMKKLIGSIFFLFLGLVLTPLVLFWISDSYGWQVGIPSGFLVGITCVVISIVLFLKTDGVIKKSISWGVVIAPVLFSLIYTLLPDCIPFISADDAMVFLAGAMASLGLAMKKSPKVPTTVVYTILIGSGLTLLGFFIPSSLDELLVQLGTIFVAVKQVEGALTRKSTPPTSPDHDNSELSTIEDDDQDIITIEGESYKAEDS